MIRRTKEAEEKTFVKFIAKVVPVVRNNYVGKGPGIFLYVSFLGHGRDGGIIADGNKSIRLRKIRT